jgi:heterodisulfide reductase subunit A
VYADEWEALVRGAGLDVRLLEVVPLREQVVYPHTGGPSSRKLQAVGEVGALTSKAQSLVGMSVGRMTALTGLGAYGQGGRQEVVRRALVVGGGAAGMSAALQMAGLGIPVELVERGEALGGQWREIGYQADGSDVQGALAEAIARVEGEERIRVHLGAEVAELGGKPGRYRSVLRNGREEAVEHGVVIVATGGKPGATREYLYGRHPAVITQRELEARLSAPIRNPQSKTKNVVMIQCVGSREPGRAYCSRVCCTQAVKNALKLKEVWPGVNVYVLYREVRTYGFRERYYEAAREGGVVFVRYELPEKPEVEGRGEKVGVRVRERVLGQTLEVEADLLVLSVGMEAAEEGELAGVLGVARDGDGYFREEHGKMKPLDLGKGKYVAGVAHSPRSLEEAIVQGQGAGLRAAAWLAGGEVLERATSVWVNERLCSFCGLCVEACPYGARVMNYERRVAEVEYGQCQGCGVCAVVCPNKATKQKAYEQRQVMAAVDMALV